VALAGGGTEATSISIGDPVAGLSYILEPETRTAYRESHIVALPARVPPGTGATGVVAGAGGRGRGALARTTPVEREAAETAAAAASQLGIRMAEVQRSGERHTENLGQQMVEGILVDGTRTTTIIPAGAIGNAQPITIVSEQWFSPELQILVSTRHSDPRTGETVYRLANIVRGEQDRSLFEVPADYTVREPQWRQRMMKFDR
jgi:hypothetical protein